MILTSLIRELALAQSKLSFSLKVLRQAGVISARQQGRFSTAAFALSPWNAC